MRVRERGSHQAKLINGTVAEAKRAHTGISVKRPIKEHVVKHRTETTAKPPTCTQRHKLV